MDLIKTLEKEQMEKLAKKADFPDIIRMEQEKGRKIGVYAVDEEDWLDMGQMSELEKMRVRLYGE